MYSDAFTLVDAVDGALVDAGAVFHIHARKGDHIRHRLSLIRSRGHSRRARRAGPRTTVRARRRRAPPGPGTATVQIDCQHRVWATMTDPPGPLPEKTSVATTIPRPAARAAQRSCVRRRTADEERAALPMIAEDEPDAETTRAGTRARSCRRRRTRLRRGRRGHVAIWRRAPKPGVSSGAPEGRGSRAQPSASRGPAPEPQQRRDERPQRPRPRGTAPAAGAAPPRPGPRARARRPRSPGPRRASAPRRARTSSATVSRSAIRAGRGASSTVAGTR